MGKLSVTLQTDTIGVNAVDSTQTAILNVKDITIATTPASDMISTDPNNDLKLGSDDKLLVDNSDIKQQIANKADSADLALINESLSQKANQSDLGKVKTLAQVNNLNISLKADQVDLDATNAQVTEHTQSLLTKADKSALEQLVQLVDTKADQNYVINEIARITGNAPAALDTLSEIAAQLGKDENQLQTLLDAVGNRLRFDTPQSLDSAQQQTARDNINAEQKGVAKSLVDAITPSSIGAATAAQGTKADTAIQSGDLAPVALTGLFSSLGGINKLFDVIYSAYIIGSNLAIKSTDTLGQMLGKLQAQISANATAVADNATRIANNAVLLPQKIGAAQKWYQSGLRHGADYPYPYAGSTLTASSGYQYFVPFTALEDATIMALEIYCATAQSNATVSLGLYASDSSNDLSNPLFTSNPIDCSAVGAKNAPCNVQIIKGKVYWLSSMIIGTPAFFRNATDSLMPIKGTTTSNQSAVIGYYTTGNTSMAQSAPTNKVDLVSPVPRVMFVT